MTELRERFKVAWSQALVGFGAAEQEAEKVIAKMADVAGFGPEEVRRQAREFTERLQTQRREIERTIDEAVKRAANRFKLPSREEIDELRRRVDGLSARLDGLASARAATQEEEKE
jgi:poly(hydroxyalkanoate) granule-associated protein